MRTHYGWVTTTCAKCAEVFCFLLLPLHAEQGAQCGKCHGLAVPPWKAKKMITEVEEAERAADERVAAVMDAVKEIEEGECLTTLISD